MLWLVCTGACTDAKEQLAAHPILIVKLKNILRTFELRLKSSKKFKNIHPHRSQKLDVLIKKVSVAPSSVLIKRKKSVQPSVALH